MIHLDSDDDGSSRSRTESPPPPPSDDEDLWPEHNETAYRVYHDLWKEFYVWEREYCAQQLSQLSQKIFTTPPNLPDSNSSRSASFNTSSHPDAQRFIIQDYVPGSSQSRIHTTVVSSEPTNVRLGITRWAPYPRYTACTPASRNIAAPPDVHLRANFAPYADDDRFDIEGYLEEFDDFMWQNDFIDPDLEIIQREAARRLHYTHELSFSDIDKLEIFAFPMRKSSREGLIWYSSQRDFQWWQGSDLSSLPKLPTNFVDPTLDLYKNVTRDLISFCPRLNCLHPFCKLHGDANPIDTNFPPKCTLTNQEITEDKGNPCPNDCYKSIEVENMNMENNHWDDTDHALFNSVLRLAPDTHPCDLAVICRKPCLEMYIQRLNIVPDFEMGEPEIEPDVDAEEAEGSDVGGIEFVDDKEQEVFFTPVSPCCHDGPCNQFSLCECYKSRQRCQRSCRCSKTCTKKKCLNTDLQKGRFHQIHVKKSQYGLGAFAVQAIPSGAYIGEYVGEGYDNDAYTYMDRLHKFTDLNYAFDLEDSSVLDSWFLGNETRYLNHSTEGYNTKAQVLFVHGEHRIVLFTLQNIQAGEELLLDYGPGYWNGKMPK